MDESTIWKEGAIYTADCGNEFEIEKINESGDKWCTYKIKCEGNNKEFRWCKKSLRNDDIVRLYNKVRQEINKENLTDIFILRPLDVVKKSIDGYEYFGYIRENIGDEYEQFLEIVNKKEKLPYKKKIDIALRIVYAYKLLGENGILYSSLAESIWINKSTGKIMIEDIIEIEEREKARMVYPRFIAPEIVEGEESDIYSHRFSLAVMLFMLLCNGHPLEGKKSVVPCISSNLRKELYGKKASFIMEEGDNGDNAPDEILHADVKKLWFKIPKYIKGLFIKDFSEKGIEQPETRVTEQEWFIALTRFRSDIVKCQYCSNEALPDPGKDTRNGIYICNICGKETKIEFELALDFDDYSIPGAVDSRIYRCQVEKECNTEDALKPVAQIIANKKEPKKLGIRNVGEKEWNAKTTAEEPRKVRPKELIPLKQGISFKVYGKEIKVRRKTINSI